MTNNEILKIEKKNPNKPNEPPTVLGIFPSASRDAQLTAQLVNSIVFDELSEVKTFDEVMERNLKEEFEKLRSNSYMTACHEIRTSNNKRCMAVYLVEK